MRSSDAVVSVAWHRPPYLQAITKILDCHISKSFDEERTFSERAQKPGKIFS